MYNKKSILHKSVSSTVNAGKKKTPKQNQHQSAIVYIDIKIFVFLVTII